MKKKIIARLISERIMYYKKKEYKLHWKNTVEKYEQIFKNNDKNYINDIDKLLNIFDLYSHKFVEVFEGQKLKIEELNFLEDFNKNQKKPKKGIKSTTNDSKNGKKKKEENNYDNILTIKGNKEFQGLSYDFEFLNLNRRLVNSLVNTYYPLDEFENCKKNIDSSKIFIYDEFVLFLNEDEQQSEKRLLFLKEELKEIGNKLKNIKFFFLYIFLYLVQKKKYFYFSKEWVSVYEEIVFEYMPNFFNSNNTSFEGLFCILYVIFEIYCYSTKHKENYLQNFFLKFFRNLSVWNREDIWESLIEYLIQVCENPFINIYYSELISEKNQKIKIKKIKDIYELLISISFNLLKLPFNTIFDIFNSINDRKKHMNTNFIMDITKKFENLIKINYVEDYKPKKNFGNLKKNVNRPEKLKILIKKVLPFLDINKDSFFNFLILSKKTRQILKQSLYKTFLKDCDLSKDKKIKLWHLISTNRVFIDHDLNNFTYYKIKDKTDYFKEDLKNFKNGTKYISLKNLHISPDKLQKVEKLTKKKTLSKKKMSKNEKDHLVKQQNNVNTINELIEKDVKRTTFVEEEKKHLRILLLEIALNYPSINYYQGMNCIGGFLLKYTKDFQISLEVFNYLMKKYLLPYFNHNFTLINQLIFIIENFLKKYNDEFLKEIYSCNVNLDFFFSPLLLTVFSCALQNNPIYDYTSLFFDAIFSEGWFGFIKMILVLTIKLNRIYQPIKKDNNFMNFFKNEIYFSILEIPLKEMKHDFANLKILKSEFRSYLNDYYASRQIVESYWKIYYENKKKKIKINQTKI